jgi:hypothetical protein
MISRSWELSRKNNGRPAGHLLSEHKPCSSKNSLIHYLCGGPVLTKTGVWNWNLFCRRISPSFCTEPVCTTDGGFRLLALMLLTAFCKETSSCRKCGTPYKKVGGGCSSPDNECLPFKRNNQLILPMCCWYNGLIGNESGLWPTLALVRSELYYGCTLKLWKWLFFGTAICRWRF